MWEKIVYAQVILQTSCAYPSLAGDVRRDHFWKKKKIGRTQLEWSAGFPLNTMYPPPSGVTGGAR